MVTLLKKTKTSESQGHIFRFHALFAVQSPVFSNMLFGQAFGIDNTIEIIIKYYIIIKEVNYTWGLIYVRYFFCLRMTLTFILTLQHFCIFHKKNRDLNNFSFLNLNS